MKFFDVNVTGSFNVTGSTEVVNITASYAISAETSSYSDNSYWTASGANIERFSDVIIEGVFYANEKHFYIDHPTKDGMKLIYGTLEGPENAVYIRGSLIDSNTIKLPDYWNKLVDENSITVHLTPIGKHQKLYIKNITIREITIKKSVFSFGKIACCYTIYAERKDVAKLKTEVYKK